MTSTIVSDADLTALVARLVAAGTRTIAPAATPYDPRRTEYRAIQRFEEATLGGPLPRRSLKEFFLPPSEVLLRYRQNKGGVDVEEVPTTFPPQVILGARPCDAAGVETLDRVMGWGTRDELWFGRREATTVVSLACPGADSTCFCSAVGLGPDATRGADALLVPLGRASVQPSSEVAKRLREAVDAFLSHAQSNADGAAGIGDASAPHPATGVAYLARALTPKGEVLLAGAGKPLAAPEDVELAEAFARSARERVAQNVAAFSLAPEGRPQLETRLGLAAADGGELLDATLLSSEQRTGVALLPEWLARNFDHELWKTLALRCHGCGACTAVCSTCHCFDIVDEHDSYGAGVRRRNWDFCQSAKFTAHASGHNPRKSQTERFRQRVMHKFSIYPRRFDAILCTGCGRCARACGAGMNLPEILGRLVQLARTEPAGSNA
ncbi:MAG TPA: 4Fe-4S dicluster domain-containing protein [Anaeromyxobacter sp.]|nr:4Fe-4S dicluster domain-containing protein [Anaeromyxobacter sp.]